MWLAKLAYELTMLCQKHNLTSPITTQVANNFSQVIYSMKNQYSYDVTRKYLTIIIYYKYFQFSSNTIYSMSSTESKRNKPERYPKQGQELFPGNYQRTTSQGRHVKPS